MNGKLKSSHVPCEWTVRVLYDGETAVVENGHRAIALLTGDDDTDCCHTLPTEEFTVPKGFATKLCDLLNSLEWYDDAHG